MLEIAEAPRGPGAPDAGEGVALPEAFLEVRRRSSQLCEPLSPEDCIPQPAVFVSPPKWHLGHTTWFFEEMVLKAHQPDYQVFDDDFAFVFNSYYNSVGKRILRASRGNLTRPALSEVHDYRRHVDQHMMELLASDSLSAAARELVILGLHHEQQHQELLLTDTKYILGHNPLFPVYGQPFIETVEHAIGNWVAVPEGIYEIGFEGGGFCYDNEIGRHKVYLHPFQVRDSLVTNGEMMDFIEDGGYERFELWLDEGWSWVNQECLRAPLYWHRLDGVWHAYTLGGLRALDPAAVLCHVSWYEAAAIAEWRGLRLPTEAEWEVAADRLSWGCRWEWTHSAYLPYPGFARAEGAVGEYNGKFMINQMVLRGGSVATSPGHSRKTYRNFFHPDSRWQFSGVRLAKNAR